MLRGHPVDQLMRGYYSPDLDPDALQSTASFPTDFSKTFWTQVPSSSNIGQSVVQRDEYRCHFCGFSSAKYQVVLARNGRSWALDDAVTACIFCANVFQLDEVDKMRAGVMIYAPEITQATLHRLARAIYVARISPGNRADEARELLNQLTNRRAGAKDRLGFEAPASLVERMTTCSTVEADGLRNSLEGIRLLPLDRRIVREGDIEFNQFPQILAYWRSKDGPFWSQLPATWPDDIFMPYLDGRFAELP